jgi:hypothetical protein
LSSGRRFCGRSHFFTEVFGSGQVSTPDPSCLGRRGRTRTIKRILISLEQFRSAGALMEGVFDSRSPNFAV